ncbi:MAG: methylated-DNA--[protein]-cysteine S-methyltransferase, partial [Planctomycetes bacterium]|nr:methylated-DNA--[protein]-cysteine S-methyltransferase [Planctomycetota bacterium]
MDGTRGCTVFDTAIGPCGIAWNEHGVDRVQLPDGDRKTTTARIRSFAASRPELSSTSRRIPSFVRDATRRLKAHLGGRLDALADVPVDLRSATPFATAVYDALRRTAPGEVLSYGELAHAAGRPKAARAVGRAMATNPVPLLVPCHRVLASDRSLH